MKKIISLLLALAMALGLAACGKSGGDVSTSQTEDDSKKLTIGIQIRANVESLEDNDLTRWLEEDKGYNLNFVEFATGASEWRSQFNTMIASGEKLPDIMFGFGWNNDERYTYGADGYILDLTPYFQDEELTADYRARIAELFGEEYYEEMLKSISSPDGKIYGYPNINFSNTSSSTYVGYINTTWLKNLGLEMPTTWDELVTVLRAFKEQDPNGNGKMDEIPALGVVPASNTTTGTTTYDLPAYLLNNWLYLDDSKFFNSENGKLYSPYVTEEYREGLKGLNELVTEGLLSSLCWTMETSELKGVVSPPDGTAIVGLMAAGLNTFTTENPIMYEYEPLPPLNYAPMVPQIPPAYIYITEDCENPEQAFKMLLEMSTLEGTMRIVSGVEGEHWQWEEDDTTAGKGIRVLKNFSVGSHAVNWGISYGIVRLADPDETVFHNIRNPEKVWLNRTTDQAKLHGELYRAAAAANNPEEVVNQLIYVEEESEAIGNIKMEVLEYMKETRAKFATGILDPNNDADWNTYVQTMYDMGLQTWLDNSQSAWDRMNAQ